jgi:hypothetical protein
MPIKELSLTEIQALLEAGNFDDFINARENEFLEAKPPSPFDMAGGHPTNIKLAKYAASFANQKGGYVICGLTIARPENTPHHVITALDLFRRETFYESAEVVSRIAQSTYPSITVEVRWHPYSANAELGLGVIYIAPQEEAKKFFHIRVREMEGNTLQRELFGVPIRGDGSTDWISVDELYRRSKAGPNNLREFYDGLSAQIETLAHAGRAATPDRDTLQQKIDQIP